MSYPLGPTPTTDHPVACAVSWSESVDRAALQSYWSLTIQPSEFFLLDFVAQLNLRTSLQSFIIIRYMLIALSSHISGLNCSVIPTQWHFLEPRCCVQASEVPDLRFLDLNCGARLHDEAMPVEGMELRVQVVVMHCGKLLF